MDFGLWETYYRKILDDFGFERKDDEKLPRYWMTFFLSKAV